MKLAMYRELWNSHPSRALSGRRDVSGSKLPNMAAWPSAHGSGVVILAGRCILVVEDEPLVCLDITRRLQDAGAKVFAASHVEKALRLAEHPELSAGVLDFD